MDHVAGAGFECLAEDVDEVMGLYSEVLQSPALPEDKIALYETQVSSTHHTNDLAGSAKRLSAGLMTCRHDVIYVFGQG